MIEINLLLAVAALPILVRVICIVHGMSRRAFVGFPCHFIGLGLGFIAIGASALCAVFMLWQASSLFAIGGTLCLVLFDRRRMICFVLDCPGVRRKP